MHNILPAPRPRQRPITSEQDQIKYHKKGVDVLDQKWYDEPGEREPDWPENFDHAKIKKVGGDPIGDQRPRCVQKWHRPLSAERIYSERIKKQLDMQRGQSLAALLGKEQVILLKENHTQLKTESLSANPPTLASKPTTFTKHFQRTDKNQVILTKQQQLAEFYQKFHEQLERDKKQMEAKIRQ